MYSVGAADRLGGGSGTFIVRVVLESDGGVPWFGWPRLLLLDFSGADSRAGYFCCTRLKSILFNAPLLHVKYG